MRGQGLLVPLNDCSPIGCRLRGRLVHRLVVSALASATATTTTLPRHPRGFVGVGLRIEGEYQLPQGLEPFDLRVEKLWLLGRRRREISVDRLLPQPQPLLTHRPPELEEILAGHPIDARHHLANRLIIGLAAIAEQALGERHRLRHLGALRPEPPAGDRREHGQKENGDDRHLTGQRRARLRSSTRHGFGLTRAFRPLP